MLVELAEQLERQGAAGLREPQEAELIVNDEVELNQLAGEAPGASGGGLESRAGLDPVLPPTKPRMFSSPRRALADPDHQLSQALLFVLYFRYRKRT